VYMDFALITMIYLQWHLSQLSASIYYSFFTPPSYQNV
jgi:hypothetical protein